MQKILITFLFFSIHNTINAQFEFGNEDNKLIGLGSKLVFVGNGAPNFEIENVQNNKTYGSKTAINGSGPYHVKYQFGIRDRYNFGITYNVNYYSAIYNSAITNTETQVWCLSNAINIKNNLSVIQNKRAALYIGLGGGINLTAFWTNSKYKYIQEDVKIEQNFANKVPLSFDATIGGMALITKRIGIYAECGYAKSVAQAGIFYKLN
jgi:hypothetical protein